MGSSNTGDEPINWLLAEENRLGVADEDEDYKYFALARIPNPGDLIRLSHKVWKIIRTDQNGNFSYPTKDDNPENGPDNGYNHSISGDVKLLNYYEPF